MTPNDVMPNGTDGARKDAAVIDLVDLVNLRHRVTAHSAVLLQVAWGHLAAQSNERPGTDRPPRRGDTEMLAWASVLTPDRGLDAGGA